MNLAELAAKYRRLASTAYPTAVEAAATKTRADLEDALSRHVRTGNAAASLSVTGGAGGVAVDGVRYQRFIGGVPRDEELQDLVVENYNAAVRAELGGGS